jgi:predicted transcriptional regulator
MGTEILVNDGGAPARMIAFIAAEDITAGDAVSIDADGKAVKADTDLFSGELMYMAGPALTDASSGDEVSVITGKGIICNVNTDGTNAGKGLKISSTPGQLTESTYAADAFSTVCAIALDDTAISGNLHRVLIIGG